VSDGDKYLSLIDSTGRIITKSVKLVSIIHDAKVYNNQLIVTCYEQCKVFLMSVDGKSTSTFSDLSPYCTKGLCVTHTMEVMV